MNNILQPNNTTLTLTDADTEYSWTPPASTGYFSIQNRSAFDIRISMTTGKVAGPTDPYFTLKSGQIWNSPERMILNPGTIIYMASAQAAVIAEIVYWTQIG